MTRPNETASALLTSIASLLDNRAAIYENVASACRDFAEAVRRGDVEDVVRMKTSLDQASGALGEDPQSQAVVRLTELLSVADQKWWSDYSSKLAVASIATYNSSELARLKTLHSMTGCGGCEIEAAMAKRLAVLTAEG